MRLCPAWHLTGHVRQTVELEVQREREQQERVELEVEWDGEGREMGSLCSISKLIERTFSSALQLRCPGPCISCQLPFNLN